MTPPFISAPSLAALPGVRHGFFTREGGVSAGLYASLNAGRGSKDDPYAVAENRRRVAEAFDATPERLLTPYQIHSACALPADQPWGEARPEGDAVVTAVPGLVCSVLTADCAPILLADAGAGVVAAAHAGWKGALGGVIQATVDAMAAKGARLANIVAVVGPCIGVESYEVGLEFFDAFTTKESDAAQFFKPGALADKRQFDLAGFVLHRLQQAGVGQSSALWRDTYAEEALFFSNRRGFHRGESDYGRLISVIRLD